MNKRIYYLQITGEKVSYSIFRQRISRWYSLEEAIKLENKRNKLTFNQDGWRICYKCLQFKKWEFFNKCSTRKTLYTWECKECSKKRNKAYRETPWWKIKTKNHHIISRADPEYRKYEWEKYKERSLGNLDKLFERRRVRRKLNFENIKQRKKDREKEFLQKNTKVMYWWVIWTIVKDRDKKDRWVLVELSWMRIFIAKSKLRHPPNKKITI